MEVVRSREGGAAKGGLQGTLAIKLAAEVVAVHLDGDFGCRPGADDVLAERQTPNVGDNRRPLESEGEMRRLVAVRPY